MGYWLELLIVPAALAFGVAWYTNTRIRADRKAAEDRRQGDRRQAYIERMMELLSRDPGGLRQSEPGDIIRSSARITTLSMLRTLDGKRKGLLLCFLHESWLIRAIRAQDEMGEETDIPTINLRTADLRDANLEGADLRDVILEGADLTGAILEKADLERAHLSEAILRGVNLKGAFLEQTKLKRAYLEDAHLECARLYGTSLKGADLTNAEMKNPDLSGANLTDAQVTDEQLARAKSLEGAIMPDGTKHE